MLASALSLPRCLVAFVRQEADDLPLLQPTQPARQRTLPSVRASVLPHRRFAARRQLAAVTPEAAQKLREEAARVLEIDDPAKITDAYLLGIQNIQAETLEYKQRVAAEADGISGRLKAEGEADLAAVRGDFETKINALLGSPAGRAYVAWKSAENVKFSDVLTFQSREGIPSVLRLRNFALQFMGGG